MGFLKVVAVLVTVLWMAAVESVQPRRPKDDEDVALFVGSAHPLAGGGRTREVPARRPLT